jgi:carbamate kinase
VNDTLVISLGGNAFATEDNRMTMSGQFAFAEKALAPLAPALRQGRRILITHGNGPQVGYILTRVEEALGKAYRLPLEVCVAESEGEIGYVLQQTLHNLSGGKRPIATLLTQVRVNPDDPAFAKPTKPIGPWFTTEQRVELERAGIAMVMDDKGRGRRVVPSPAPESIVETQIIRQMLDLGVTVIAAGGGGIPVIDYDGQLQGIEAVVDKDLATALLATEVKASLLVLVTGVPGVYTDFETKQQRLLGKTNPRELGRLLEEGHFPPGTMGPKVQAAIRYVQNTGNRAVICQSADLTNALNGSAGTIIEPELI